MLSARRKELTKLGKGNKPNATRPLTSFEVDHLYEVGYFGTLISVSLQRTMWWITAKHFGHRARDEARQLLFGDIKLDRDVETGQAFIVWDTERSRKQELASVLWATSDLSTQRHSKQSVIDVQLKFTRSLYPIVQLICVSNHLHFF